MLHFYDTDRTQASNFGHLGEFGARGKQLLQLQLDLVDAPLPVGLDQQLDTRDGYRAGQRIGHERGAMHEHSRLPLVDRVTDFGGSQGGGKTHVTPGQRLAHAHDIRRYVGMLAGKQLAAATKAGRNFVGNKQYIVTIAKRARACQIVRRIKIHAAGSLNHGFQDQRGDLAMILLQQLFERLQVTIVTGLAKSTVRAFDKKLLADNGIEQAVHTG